MKLADIPSLEVRRQLEESKRSLCTSNHTGQFLFLRLHGNSSKEHSKSFISF